LHAIAQPARHPRAPQTCRIEAEQQSHAFRSEHARQFFGAGVRCRDLFENMLRNDELEALVGKWQLLRLAAQRPGAVPGIVECQFDDGAEQVRRQGHRRLLVRANCRPHTP
jgi:hypothetical protein